MSAVTAAQLREIDLFDDLSDEELQPWAAAAQLHQMPAGATVVRQGEEPEGVYLLVEGALEAIAVDPQGRAQPISEHRAPTWVGAIAAITGGLMGVQMQAVEPAVVAVIKPEPFTQLVLASPPVFRRIMSQVRPVMGRITALEQNRERLASLGTMAAGLAHELNNPAAAARRAAADLADALDVLGSTIGRFVESGMEREQAERLVELQRNAMSRCRPSGAPGALDTLQAADAEDELLDQLTDLGVSEPWRVVEPLAAAGIDAAWLDQVAEEAGPATEAALRWVAASLAARSLALDLAESTERMSRLVGAVKSYAYMDRGEVVEVDVHEGLDTTLTVLGHKLKHTSIEVRRDYDRDLPPITVHGSELNQVWTNLIDNAIDALGENGAITVTTSRDGPCVKVDIADDGPGISAEVRPHIFDPFFTTKGVGLGTGLGLDTARRIVVDRHRGSITLESEPGRTVFHVWLPIEPAPAESRAAPGKVAGAAQPAASPSV